MESNHGPSHHWRCLLCFLNSWAWSQEVVQADGVQPAIFDSRPSDRKAPEKKPVDKTAADANATPAVDVPIEQLGKVSAALAN